jgi:hypothetical protein
VILAQTLQPARFHVDPLNPYPPVFKHVLLRDARIDFAEFYRTATPDDEALMDGLLFAYAALAISIDAPRASIPPAIRRELEHATNINEQYFTRLRQQVRDSHTFVMLMRADRAKIEKAVFVVPPPSGNE